MKLYNADGKGTHRELAQQLEQLYSTLNSARKTVLETYTMDVQLDFQQWLDLGIRMGYCEEIHCMSHESARLTPEEDKRMTDGFDACVPLIRVYLEGESPCSSI